MRMLLRKATTGKYLRPSRRWTSDMDEAWDFGSVSQALEEVRCRSLPNMELVLMDVPARAGEGPFAELTLAKLLAPEVETKR